MNMSPKVRPWWQRYLLMFGTGVLWAYKALHLPRFILPRDFKSVVNNWTHEMFWVLIKSGFTRAFIDQPCDFKMPTSFKPKAQVAPQFQMGEDQIRQFYTQGFLGPFDAFSHDEMIDFKREMLALENTKSQTYGLVTPRDRHFESPRLWSYMKYPAITERCAQLLGPDLLVWRTQMFHKPPKAPAIQFHQASTFMVEDYQDPGLHPANRNEIFQLTVWVAVDDATPENGCLRLRPRRAQPRAHDQVRRRRRLLQRGLHAGVRSRRSRRLRARAVKAGPVHHLHGAVHPRLGAEHDRPSPPGVQPAGDPDQRAGLPEQEELPQRVQRRQVHPRQLGRRAAPRRGPLPAEPRHSVG